ncbi:ATP-binding protein [Pontibacillus sp. HMF3514]|uniref:ATP-binding protein n=1 Tax=Pontibacillus sp. HMF3514 TaxID=2692425 RepID=UPI0013202FB6|nr:ATP-binding protein [Pontibacillus sp. HMF3514]QHE53179.1 hypothetical protein GS400_14640 [Pontibacillus sp. HMF3514]
MAKSDFLQSKRYYILPILVLLLSIYLISVILRTPYVGIDVNQTRGGLWQVADIAPHSWADKQGIEEGTTILSVNGIPVGDFHTVTMFRTVEKASSITFLIDGSVTHFTRIEDEVSLDQWLFYIIFPSLYSGIMLVLSFFILFHNRDDESGKRLILFLLTTGLAYLAASGSSRGDFLSSVICTFTFLMAPPYLLHFIDAYFRQIDARWFSPWFYHVMKVVAILVVFIEAIFIFLGYYPLWLPSLIGFLFLLFIIMALVIIFYGNQRYRKSQFAPILQYLIAGIFVAFSPFIFLYLLPNIWFGVPIISGEASILFIMVLPMVFIYLISAQRLFDIDFVMGRLRYYAYVSIIPTSLVVLTVMLVVDHNWGVQHVFLLFLSVILIFVVFLYIKEIFDYKIQRNLFSEKNNYHNSLQRFVHDMKQETNPVGLFRRLKRELIDVIGMKEVEVFSRNTISNFFCIYQDIPLQLMHECVDRVQKLNADVGTLVELEKNRGYVLVIGHTMSKITYLYCSDKPNQTALNLDEKAYLQTISHNTNIALENLLLIEDLFQELQHVRKDRNQRYPAWLSRLLFSLSDHQRKEIAVDLHDSVLQEQLYLYRQMDDYVSRKQDIPNEVQEKLVHFREQLLDNIHLIRETCNELRPPFLEELGLIPSLENLVNQYQLRSNFTVQFESNQFHMELNSEYVLGIYRIVQELLTNAMKHSYADMVYLQITSEKGNVKVHYRDNGVGMEESNQIESFSHMGLSGIEQRINGLNGTFEIKTSKNQGFEMNIVFHDVTDQFGGETQWFEF